MPKSKALTTALKELGDNVRRERTAKKISQQKLAELADIDIRTLQRIEAGAIDGAMSTIAQIRKALDSPWGDLLPKNW